VVEVARHADVVVGQERDPVPHQRVVGEAHHLLHQRLAAVVGRMRLAGDHHLHGPIRIEQQPGQPLRIAQHQRQPLVRRNPPREADRQHIGIERGVDPAERGLGRAALQPRLVQPPPHLVDETGSQHASSSPDRLVGHLDDALPALRLLDQLAADLARGQLHDFAGHPGRRVHAVGHRRDRHVGAVEAGP